MFRCEKCKKVIRAGVKALKHVVKIRKVEYKLRDGRTTSGFETVKEITVCPLCKARLNKVILNV